MLQILYGPFQTLCVNFPVRARVQPLCSHPACINGHGCPRQRGRRRFFSIKGLLILTYSMTATIDKFWPASGAYIEGSAKQEQTAIVRKVLNPVARQVQKLEPSVVFQRWETATRPAMFQFPQVLFCTSTNQTSQQLQVRKHGMRRV